MFVYGLTDEVGEIRYVGQTALPLERRLSQHLWGSSLQRPGHKNNWLKSMLAKGQKPQIYIIQEVANRQDLDGAEAYFIDFLKLSGCNLTNGRDGGIGLRNPSTEVRERMSAAKKGKSSNRKGTTMSAATKEKLRLINTGKRASAETRAKMSAAHMGHLRHQSITKEGT